MAGMRPGVAGFGFGRRRCVAPAAARPGSISAPAARPGSTRDGAGYGSVSATIRPETAQGRMEELCHASPRRRARLASWRAAAGEHSMMGRSGGTECRTCRAARTRAARREQGCRGQQAARGQPSSPAALGVRGRSPPRGPRPVGAGARRPVPRAGTGAIAACSGTPARGPEGHYQMHRRLPPNKPNP